MAVYPDVHTSIASPANGLLEKSVCTLDERGIGVVVGPVANGNAESIKAV